MLGQTVAATVAAVQYWSLKNSPSTKPLKPQKPLKTLENTMKPGKHAFRCTAVWWKTGLASPKEKSLALGFRVQGLGFGCGGLGLGFRV